MDCAPLLWHRCQTVREQKAAFNGVRERQTLLAFQRAINAGLGSIYWVHVVVGGSRLLLCCSGYEGKFLSGGSISFHLCEWVASVFFFFLFSLSSFFFFFFLFFLRILLFFSALRSSKFFSDSSQSVILNDNRFCKPLLSIQPRRDCSHWLGLCL